uniref:FBA_2 domain-containing protein n=1 Tax=Steinernema glaseri TaxID=37863 RepID=A0A1I7XY69_9BILA
MASVPFVFMESVCVVLSHNSLFVLEYANNGPWSTVAEPLMKQTLQYSVIDAFVDEVGAISVREWFNSEEFPKFRYLDCSHLHIEPVDDSMTMKIVNPSFFSRMRTYGLNMIDVKFLDKHLNSLCPWYLKDVVITNCTFHSGAVLSSWLKKAIVNTRISTLNVSENSVVHSVDVKDNFEEEVMDLIIRGREVVSIEIGSNDSITDLAFPFFKRALDYWIASKEGYRAWSIILRYQAECEQEMDKFIEDYNFVKMDYLKVWVLNHDSACTNCEKYVRMAYYSGEFEIAFENERYFTSESEA